MKKAICQKCEEVSSSGVYLDTKNIGRYPSEVSHTYTELRTLLCGDCYLDFLKWFKEKEEIK